MYGNSPLQDGNAALWGRWFSCWTYSKLGCMSCMSAPTTNLRVGWKKHLVRVGWFSMVYSHLIVISGSLWSFNGDFWWFGGDFSGFQRKLHPPIGNQDQPYVGLIPSWKDCRTIWRWGIWSGDGYFNRKVMIKSRWISVFSHHFWRNVYAIELGNVTEKPWPADRARDLCPFQVYAFYAHRRFWWETRSLTLFPGLHTLWWTNIALENGHLEWIFPLRMVIFNCYVSSPEGTPFDVILYIKHLFYIHHRFDFLILSGEYLSHWQPKR